MVLFSPSWRGTTQTACRLKHRQTESFSSGCPNAAKPAISSSQPKRASHRDYRYGTLSHHVQKDRCWHDHQVRTPFGHDQGLCPPCSRFSPPVRRRGRKQCQPLPPPDRSASLHGWRSSAEPRCQRETRPGGDLLLGARQEITIRDRTISVIPAFFWRESRLHKAPGFPPGTCGNDG